MWWGTGSLAALGALTFVLNGNPAAAPEASPQQLAATQPAAVLATPATADPAPAPEKAVATVDAEVGAKPDTQTRPPANPQTTRVDPGARNLLPTQSAENFKRAQALRSADDAASRPVGPAEACVTQVKAVFCPIIGNIPFIRDVAGQVAMWGNFDCPTGMTPKI